MKFRSLLDSDLPEVNRLNHQQDFRLSNLKHTIVDGVVINDKHQIVAYGIVKHQAEAIILVDKAKPGISRAKALRELMKVAIFGAKKADCQQLHCFVKDPKLVELLKNHFGFVETDDVVLVKEL